MTKASHADNIKAELKAVGVTAYGMKKFAIHYLPKVIHEDEHIKGIVYGRYKDKTGSISLNEGMLIATDSRIIFLDHKPGFTLLDELTYDVVSGVTRTTAVFSAVSLRTRMGDYNIRFANANCANIFVRYVEDRRLENKISKPKG